jgi:ABC-type uncharacterized transport system permease subunit
MIDDAVESVFGTAFRIVKGLIKDILFDIACYAIGWLVLKVVTLGRYPSEDLANGIRDDNNEDTIVSIVGLVVIVVGGCLLFS